MYLPSNGSPRTANTWGYIAVHEKQEANRAATASHGEPPRLPTREGRKKQKLKREEKLERKSDTREPRGREALNTREDSINEGYLTADIFENDFAEKDIQEIHELPSEEDDFVAFENLCLEEFPMEWKIDENLLFL
ncbi:hypothetical protein AVEN_17045-1 [Araneus ventricosus]|uniref:Uncharacterized protein n=1 Tax=Araneus ventricosus TaxID=182803 RepID=A0A4Y2IK51_ARAVE|nr:hypothetical protein AVEN_17045-1 [Araneus ventricosus]